jgi:hypothetical protein
MANWCIDSIRTFSILSFRRNLTGPYESPIDVFITYDGKRAADIAVSRYAVRHLVAGEVGLG